MEMQRSLDVDSLIEAVRRRPGLYAAPGNVRSQQESRHVKAALWDEVGLELIYDWQELDEMERGEHIREIKKKWKSLRDQFVKEMRLNPGKKRKSHYLYFDQLYFLAPHTQAGKHLLNNSASMEFEFEPVHMNDDEELFEISEDVKDSDLTYSGTQPSYATLKAMADDFATTTNRLTDMLSKSMSQNEADEYGNRSFALSLVPILDAMKEDRMLEARTAILNTIKEVKKKK